MMKNYDQSDKINHNSNWLYIPDHPYIILIIGGSGSEKINVLLNLVKHQQPNIDKIYVYAKDSFESKYQLLINGREKLGTENLKNAQTIDNIYENLEDYSPTKKRRVLIVFDDVIADIGSKKN